MLCLSEAAGGGSLRNRCQNSLDEEEEGLPSARQGAGQQAVREAEPLLFARNKGEQAVSAERQHEGPATG